MFKVKGEKVDGKMVKFISRRVKQFQKRLKFAVYCFPKGDDARFVCNVKKTGKENNLVYIENYGEKKMEHVLYHIKMEYSGSGFFADHNRLLCFLYFADKYGMKPVVEYHQDYCYAEKHPVNGTNNPFEYYFKQPSDISLEEMYTCRGVIRSRKENTNDAIMLNENSNGYARTERYIGEMARITKKYLSLREEVRNEIWGQIHKLFKINMCGQILGVHFRGTDFKRNYNGHPVNLTIEDYFLEIDKRVAQGYQRIFLATDDLDAVVKMKERYGEKVIYYDDVVRSSGDETVMNSADGRENHHYRLGLEVLRDMFTLAECDGLIAGLSQVSIAARIQKKSYDKEYEDLVIIDKGMNYHKSLNCLNT